MDTRTRFVLRGIRDELAALDSELKEGGLPGDALQRVRSAIAQAKTDLKKIDDGEGSQRPQAARHLERAAEVIAEAAAALDALEEGLEGQEIVDAFQGLGWDVPVSEAAAYYFDLDALLGEMDAWAEELLGARKALLGLNVEETDV